MPRGANRANTSSEKYCNNLSCSSTHLDEISGAVFPVLYATRLPGSHSRSMTGIRCLNTRKDATGKRSKWPIKISYGPARFEHCKKTGSVHYKQSTIVLSRSCPGTKLTTYGVNEERGYRNNSEPHLCGCPGSEGWNSLNFLGYSGAELHLALVIYSAAASSY
jgi:hypothetical protein